MIVGAIREQQVAVISEFTATQALMGEGFVETQNRLDLQIESGLQLEVGRKLADAEALRGKLVSFGEEIKQRFNKSIENVAFVRRAYDVNFVKIANEYTAKIRQIGDHIFSVRDEDIVPAIESSKTSYEVAHSLPIEMDLRRIDVRAEHLDDTLEMLSGSRLSEVLGCLDAFESTLARYSIPENLVGQESHFWIEGLATVSPLSRNVVVGAIAGPAGGTSGVALSSGDPAFQAYSSVDVAGMIDAALSAAGTRNASDGELSRFQEVASRLLERELISEDARNLFAEFLASGGLKLVEHAHGA